MQSQTLYCFGRFNPTGPLPTDGVPKPAVCPALECADVATVLILVASKSSYRTLIGVHGSRLDIPNYVVDF